MQHEGSNLLGSLRRHLTEVTVAGLTGATIAVITSYYRWPGAVIGAAFAPMFTTVISPIYKGYVDRVGKIVLMADRPTPPPLGPLADRPPPPPLGPTSRAPKLPKLIQVSAALRWFFCERLLKGGDRFSIEVFNSEWSRPSSAWASSPRLSLN
jgi:hypothetical protein